MGSIRAVGGGVIAIYTLVKQKREEANTGMTYMIHNPNIPLFNCCSICVLYSAGTSKEILCGLPP